MELIISSTENSAYIVTGAVKELLKNRRSGMLLRSNLSFEEENGILSIQSDEPIERVAHLIGLSAKYIGAEVRYDSVMTTELQEFRNGELAFEEFSTQAKQIKANNCNKADLEKFSKSLCNNMLNRRLYPMQLLSAYHLAFSQNGCNFSVPGAGKTSIVYGAYTYLKSLPETDNKKVDCIMIVCPLSAFGPWESEYEECYGRKAASKRINGQLATEHKKQYFYGDTDELILISYSSVVSVKEQLIYFIRNHKVMVVLDEAHKIKNTNGGITAASLMQISQYCKSRVILTGTPAPNGYEDVYNLFNFIWPKRNVTKYTIGQLRDMTKCSGDDSRIRKLMDNIDPFYVRIKKSDLGITPPIENSPIRIEMKESQRRVYDFIEKKFIEEAESNNGGLYTLLTRARLVRLQQVATNPALLRQPITVFTEAGGDDYSSVADSDGNIMQDILKYCTDEIPAKFEACVDLTERIIQNGGKVVIWAIFINTIELLLKYLESRGIQSRSLYGATPVATDGMTEEDEGYELTRESIIKEFHKDDCDFKVIIANPFAVAESISLHKACHNAIYLERSFNCAHFIQSKDRIHRYGLKEGVETNYYYILSQDSIDDTIDERLRIKEERMLSIIESMPIPLFNNLGNDGDEDIKAIISDYVERKNRKA